MPCPGNEEKEAVNHPAHYTFSRFEVMDVIAEWRLNFALGAVIKYVARCDYKGKPIEDLKKAAWYLDYEIRQRENAGNPDD